MSDLEDVQRLATALPDVTEGERHCHRTWPVAGEACGTVVMGGPAGEDVDSGDALIVVSATDAEQAAAVFEADSRATSDPEPRATVTPYGTATGCCRRRNSTVGNHRA